jgi:hypothetical protein
MRALEPKPLIVAALIGAAGYWLLSRKLSGLALGAGVGVAVQLGVRLAGVS